MLCGSWPSDRAKALSTRTRRRKRRCRRYRLFGSCWSVGKPALLTWPAGSRTAAVPSAAEIWASLGRGRCRSLLRMRRMRSRWLHHPSTTASSLVSAVIQALRARVLLAGGRAERARSHRLRHPPHHAHCLMQPFGCDICKQLTSMHFLFLSHTERLKSGVNT